MTGKLMKYELRGCMRIFLPLWAAVLVLSVINGFTIGNQANISGFWPRMIMFALPREQIKMNIGNQEFGKQTIHVERLATPSFP